MFASTAHTLTCSAHLTHSIQHSIPRHPPARPQGPGEETWLYFHTGSRHRPTSQHLRYWPTRNNSNRMPALLGDQYLGATLGGQLAVPLGNAQCNTQDNNLASLNGYNQMPPLKPPSPPPRRPCLQPPHQQVSTLRKSQCRHPPLEPAQRNHCKQPSLQTTTSWHNYYKGCRQRVGLCLTPCPYLQMSNHLAARIAADQLEEGAATAPPPPATQPSTALYVANRTLSTALSIPMCSTTSPAAIGLAPRLL